MKRVSLMLLIVAAACGSSDKPTIGVPTISVFTAAPPSVALGESTQLIFAASAGSTLTIDPGAIDVSGKTSLTVTPADDTTYTLTARSEGGTTTKTVSVTVIASRSAAFRLTQSGNAIAGGEVTFGVAALDTSGAVNTNYRGTVQFTTDDAQGTVPGEATFSASNAGQITARATFKTAGTRTFVVADKAVASAQGIARVAVSPAAAARLALSGVPASVVAGDRLAIAVTAFDPYDNVATGFAGTVHFSSPDATAQLPADFTFTAADRGSRTFAVVLTKIATTSITVSSAGLPASTANIVVSAGAARVTFEGLPAQVLADAIQTVTVTVRDAFGDPVTDYVGTIHVTTSDAQASVIPPDTTFAATDHGAKTVTVQFGTAGVHTLSASDAVNPSIAGSAATQVKHGASAGLLLEGLPPSSVAGTLLTATVKAVDKHGNLMDDFAGTVHFSSTDANAQLPADFTFTAADAGLHTFPLALITAAASSVTVSSSGLPAATANIAVRHAAAARVTLEGLPAQVVVDVSQNVTVTVRDAFGNPVTDYAGTIHFTSRDALASSTADATFTAADLGVKVVAVQFANTGTQTLSASDTVRPSIAGAASTLVVHGPAARLVLTRIPSSTVAGALLAPTVTVVDNRGNAVTDFTGTIHFSSTDPNATLPADTTFSIADSGVRGFSVALTTVGARSVSISQVDGLATGATASVTVVNALASRITLDGHAAQVAVDTNAAFTVTIRDRFGNPALDYTGTVHFVASDLGASAIGNVTFTPAMFATIDVTLQFAKAGDHSLIASDTINAAITGSAAIKVTNGPAARLVLAGLPSSTVAGTALPVTVKAVDNHDNVVTDFAKTVHFASTDPDAQLPADFAFTGADAGSRLFAVMLARAAISSLTVSATGLLSATANIFVGHAGAAQVTISGLPALVVVDAVQNLTVTVRDAFGNAVTDYAGTLHFTSSDAQASSIPDTAFTAADLGVKIVTVKFGTAGTQTLSASDTVRPSVAGSSVALVQHGPAARLLLAGIPSSTVAGTVLTATLSAVDNHGNPVTDFAGTVHFSSTDSTAQLPADFAFTAGDLGSRTLAVVLTRAATSGITASSAGLPSVTVNIVVRNAAAAQVTLAGLAAQVVVNVSQNVTVTVRDAFGNPATDYAGTLHFTSSDAQAPSIPDTTFTAADLGVKVVSVQFGTAGTQSLSASDTVRPSIAGSASTLVVHGPAARLVLTRIPSSTVAGALLTPTVTAVDSRGNAVTDFTGTIHFSSTDPNATLPADTTFGIADAGARSFSVALTTAGARSVSISQVGGLATGATANVAVVNAPASRITLDAHAAQVAVDANAVFTVTIRDRFGNPALDYTGTVHFVSSDIGATAIGNVTFAPAMFATTDVTLQFATAGDQSLIASDTVNAAISGSAAIKVTHGPAARLVLAGLPSSTVAGTALPATITAVDSHGNVVTDFGGTVHFASTDPNAQLPADFAFTAANLGSRAFAIVLTRAATSSVTVNSLGLPAATTTIVVRNAGAAQVALQGLPAQVVAEATQTITVTVRDAFGNTATDYTGTLHFTSTDAQASSIPDTTFALADLGIKVVTVQFGTAGGQLLSTSDTVRPFIAGSASTRVVHGPASRLLLSGIPSSIVAGTVLTPIVTAVDNRGNVATDFTGTVHFSSTDPAAQLPADVAFTLADAGVRAFAVVLTRAGPSSVTVSSVGLLAATANIIVLAGTARVTLEGLPAQVVADVTQNVTVTVRDAFGNPMTSYTGTLHFTSSDPQASPIPDTTFLPADLGVKVVKVQFGTAGTQSLSASDTVTPSITGSALTLVVHGPAARLVLAGIPPSTVAGTLLTPTVTVVDNHGNVVTDFGGTVHFASSDAKAQLPADFVFTPADLGSRSFPVVLARAATSTVTVSSTSLLPATVTVVVRQAGATQVTLEGLPAQVVVDVSQNVTVTVRDAFGNTATDYTGTIHFTNSDPQASSIPDTPFAAADLGVKVVTVQFGAAGTQTLSATDTVRPSIAGSATTQVRHGPAARFALTGIPPSTVAGTLLIATVTAVDNHGNVVTEFTGTVHFSSTDPTAQLPADFTFTLGDAGSRTFPFVLTKAATSSVTVGSPGLLAATSTVVVRNAPAAQVTLAGLPAQVVVDTIQTVTVTVRDAFGNTATDYTGTLHFTNTDAQATSIPDTKFLPADLGAKVATVQFATAGAQTLSASDTVKPSVVGSASTSIVHGPAARLLLTRIPPSTVAGTLLTPIVAAVDNHGNVVTDFTGTVHFSSTDPNATLPGDTAFGITDAGVRSFSVALTTAGARSVSVSQVGGAAIGATVNVSVANAPASRITLDAHAAQVAVDINAVFTVTIRDRFGNPALDYTGTVHFASSDPAGTVSGNVTFTPAMFATTDVSLQFATAGQQSLLASDTINPSIAGSVSIQVTHGPAARLVLAGIPPSTVAGTLLTPAVTAVDNHANLVNDFAGTVHFSSTDPNAQLPADFTFKVTDLGSRTFPVVLTSAASSSVTVASTGLAPATGTVVVRNAAAAQLTLEGLPAQVVVGVIQSVTVVARDAFRNPAIDYRGTVHFTNTDLQASKIPDATFGAADLGVKLVTVQFGTAGPQTLTASDTVTQAIAGSASTLVKPGPASRLVLAGLPSSTVAGTLLTPTVTALDTLGNVATDFLGTVHVTSTDPNAQLPVDFAFVAADQGSRTFPVVLTRAGTSSLTVSSVGVTAATASIVVRQAGAARLTLEGLPPQVVVDVTQNITVTARDAFGNPATDYAGTIHFTNSDAQASLIPDASFLPADLGVRIVTVRFGTAGVQSLSASDTVKPSISGSATTLVLHGPAARLLLAGIPSSTVAGTLLTPSVTSVDSHGNLVTDFAGTIHVSSTDPTAQLPADFTFTPADQGSRTVPVVLTKAATSSVTVSSTGLVSATASVTVRNAPASQVTLEGLPAQVVVDVVQTVTVRARDAFGNPATDYVGIIHFTNTDAQASSVADTTFVLADLGAKTVTVRFGTAGTQTLSAKDTVRPSIAGSATTLVVHGPAARLTLTGIPSSTVAGTLLTPTVTAVDNHANLVTDFTGTVHFTSTDPNATLPPDTAFAVSDGGVRSFSVALTTVGARSVSVSQVGGTITGATASVTVSSAPASRITLDAHATQVAVDTDAVFTVTIRDRFGNPALNYTGTVHFVSSDLRATLIKDVTFTPAMFATTDVTLQFATAGDQSLLATDTVNPAITGSAAIKVTNGPAAAYALSALPTAAVAGEPLPLTITATDAHGNTVLNYTGSAAVTSIDPTDRLPAAGTFVGGVRSVSLAFVTGGPHHATVTEVAGLIHADTSVVTIVSGSASTLVLSSASATAGTPASTNVVAKDAFGNVAVSYRGTVTLTSTDPQAVLPPPSTFVAGDAGQHAFPVTLKTAGTWSVTATDVASAISGSATFTVGPAAAASCNLTIIGKAGSQVALRVRVADPFANLATGYSGTMTFSSTDARAQLPVPTTYTATDRGSRDFTAALPSPGDQTIIATDSATSFSCQASVTIITAQFFAVTFTGAEGWAGTPRPATVQAQDATGAPITNYKGTIVFSSSDPAASFPPSVTLLGTEGGHATVNVTFNTIGLQTFTAKDSADPTKTGTAFQLVHGLTYTDPPTGGKVRLVLNAAASTTSVVQLDLVSNASLFTLGVIDPQNSSRVLPSSNRNGAFAAGMNLPIDVTKVGPDTPLLVQAPPASAILNLGGAPQAVGAALANGVLYSGISQKRFDLTLICTPPCTNDHLRGDVQARPFPGANSLYYSLRLKLTPGAASGTVFDGQALASNARFRAAVRDRSGSDVFSSTSDFAIGKLEVK